MQADMAAATWATWAASRHDRFYRRAEDGQMTGTPTFQEEVVRAKMAEVNVDELVRYVTTRVR